MKAGIDPIPHRVITRLVRVIQFTQVIAWEGYVRRRGGALDYRMKRVMTGESEAVHHAHHS